MIEINLLTVVNKKSESRQLSNELSNTLTPTWQELSQIPVSNHDRINLNEIAVQRL